MIRYTRTRGTVIVYVRRVTRDAHINIIHAHMPTQLYLSIRNEFQFQFQLNFSNYPEIRRQVRKLD